MQGSKEVLQEYGCRSQVVLVDAQGRELGLCEKLEAHRRGLRHLAFSVFLISPAGHWLLQRRAAGKYHSPGLWANSCCGHPLHGEPLQVAAERRVREELGVGCTLIGLRDFSYRREVGGGLIENELVSVFVGTCEEPLAPDPEEVAQVRWSDPVVLLAELQREPEHFTVWFQEYVAHFGKEILTWAAPTAEETR